MTRIAIISDLHTTGKGKNKRLLSEAFRLKALGTIKWNKEYTRARRRGLKGLNFEITLICCGFNLHKYHLKTRAAYKAA